MKCLNADPRKDAQRHAENFFAKLCATFAELCETVP
jgi:hypothetical protein